METGLSSLSSPESNSFGHIVAVDGGSRLHERPVEEVTVVGDEDVWSHLVDVLEESLKVENIFIFKSIYFLSIYLLYLQQSFSYLSINPTIQSIVVLTDWYHYKMYVFLVFPVLNIIF